MVRITARSLAIGLLGLVAWVGKGHAQEPHTWTDTTGNYSITAGLIGFNDDTVVLKNTDGELLAVPVAQLSEADREYLKTDEALASNLPEGDQVWTLAGGFQFRGHVVSHVEREIVFQRKRGRLYVNDRAVDNLPDPYQRMLPKVIGHFEKVELADKQALLHWMADKGSRPRTYQVSGVMMAVENGDEYAVPYFLFSDADRVFLERQAAPPAETRPETGPTPEQEAAAREQQALFLQARAAEYQQDRMADRQLKMVELGLLAVNAGITDVWEVAMLPPDGNWYLAQAVVVPARNSADAGAIAAQRYPGYRVGAIRRVNR